MDGLIEAVVAFVFGLVASALIFGVTLLPWALGIAYMLGWL